VDGVLQGLRRSSRPGAVRRIIRCAACQYRATARLSFRRFAPAASRALAPSKAPSAGKGSSPRYRSHASENRKGMAGSHPYDRLAVDSRATTCVPSVLLRELVAEQTIPVGPT
jgi:hypothetical protein